MKKHRNSYKGEMTGTTRLAAAGIGVVALAGAVQGVQSGAHLLERSSSIADHINHPDRIPVSERIDIAVPHGTSAPALAGELAPHSGSDQANLSAEMNRQMQDGVLRGVVHVDKSLVEVHPHDVNFIDPASGIVAHPPKQ